MSKQNSYIEIPIQVIKIDTEGTHLHVKILINGKSGNMVLDTGASQTVFDKKLIKNYVKDLKAKKHDQLSSGLGTNSMKSHKILIKKMKLGTLQISNYESVVLDLSHVNKSYGQIGLKPVAGILGGDILSTYNAVISYEEKLLKIQKQISKKKKKS